MGGRQTAAAPRVATVLSAGIQPVHRAVCRQRRRLSRPLQHGPARGASRCASPTSTPTSIGCYRAVRDAVDDVIDELRQLEAGHQAGGREHFYEVRNERFNPVRREVHARRAAGGSVHAGARGDADLSQSRRLQRPVPRQLTGGVQRAGRTSRLAANLRSGQSAPPGDRAADPEAVARGAAVSRRAGRGGRGGLRVPRSAVCARQPDGVLHVVHDRRVSGRGSRTRCSAR